MSKKNNLVDLVIKRLTMTSTPAEIKELAVKIGVLQSAPQGIDGQKPNDSIDALAKAGLPGNEGEKQADKLTSLLPGIAPWPGWGALHL